MDIRLYKKGDISQVSQLLGDSVSILDSQEYTETEVRSFAPDHIHFENWEKTCLEKFTIVAESDNNIVGIAQVDHIGHISCFYCHPEYRRRGIGQNLFTALEEYAQGKNMAVLHTETNPLNLPFYVKMGFKTVQQQNVLIGGEVKEHFIIEKELS
ncbi:MAG: GNAT family N-acetyltransferase [Bacteroidota bacterium]